jgi:hypothetical protein
MGHQRFDYAVVLVAAIVGGCDLTEHRALTGRAGLGVPSRSIV